MFKEMPVIPVIKVVDLKRIIGKKWRAEEEERHKGSLSFSTKELQKSSAHLANSEDANSRMPQPRDNPFSFLKRSKLTTSPTCSENKSFT
jgi:hypothetical protein